MPGVSTQPPRYLRPKAPLWRQAALGFVLVSIAPARADDGTLPPAPAPEPSAAVHLSDEGDRVLDGRLKPEADRRSRADALYAEAMLRLEDMASPGDQERALEMFRQVVGLDPAFSDAQLKLANLLLQTGRLDEAYQRLVVLLKAHPDSVPAQVELGYTQRLRGQNEDALKLCTRALAADSSQSIAMRVILEISAGQNDLAGGVLRVEDILKGGGAEVPSAAWLALDRLYQEYARGQMESSTNEAVLRTRLPILQQAVDKSAGDVDTLTELAKIQMALGRRLGALKTLQRASALDPANADLLFHCAELELKLDQPGDAIRDYEKAYALNPAMPDLRDRLGHLYLDNKRDKDAVAFYEKALADSPHEAALEVDLGVAYEATHHPDKADACFRDVFESPACTYDAYLELAFFQLGRKEIKQAARTLTAAAKLFPQSAWVSYYQALQHRLEKNYDAALASFAQAHALAVGPDAAVLDQNFYIQNALVFSLAGKKEQAEAVLREGLSHYPDNPDLMNELAYFWAEQGSHLPEALALSRRAGTLEPDNGPIMDTCGWVYFQMGQIKDSLPYLQRAAVMTNNDPVVLQHVGDAYLKLGLRREAIATWTQALEKDPHNGDLISRIDAAQAQATNVHLRSAPKP